MPWDHCEQVEIADNEVCPGCGITKAAWTVQVDKTRVMQIARKKVVSLRLLRPDDSPVVGQRVELLLPEGIQVALETDAQGALSVPCAQKGTFSARFPGEDPAAITQEGRSARKEAQREPGCFYGRTNKRVTFRLAQAEANYVDLELTDGRGELAAGWRFELLGAQGELLAEGVLDEAGYHHQPLPAGVEVCDLRFSPPREQPALGQLPAQDWLALELQDAEGAPAAGWGYALYERSGELYLEGTHDAQGCHGAFVPRGRGPYQVRFTPPRREAPAAPAPAPGAWVALELQDEQGQPAAGWGYELIGEGGALLACGSLDAAGRHTRQLPAGVRVCDARFLPPRRVPAAAPAQEAAPWIQLALVDAEGQPAAGAGYELLDAEGQVLARGQLDEQGRATQVLAPGREACDVRFRPPPPAPPAPAAFPAQGSVQIELLDASGSPAAGWGYELLTPAGEAIAAGTLDAQGRHSRQVPAGLERYDLRFTPPRAAPAPAPAPAPAGEAWTELELRDEAGHPAAGWRFELRHPSGELLTRGSFDAGGRRRVALPAGLAHFDLRTLPPLE